MIHEGCLGGHDGKGFWNNVEPGSSLGSEGVVEPPEQSPGKDIAGPQAGKKITILMRFFSVNMDHFHGYVLVYLLLIVFLLFFFCRR